MSEKIDLTSPSSYKQKRMNRILIGQGVIIKEESEWLKIASYLEDHGLISFQGWLEDEVLSYEDKESEDLADEYFSEVVIPFFSKWLETQNPNFMIVPDDEYLGENWMIFGHFESLSLNELLRSYNHPDQQEDQINRINQLTQDDYSHFFKELPGKPRMRPMTIPLKD